MTGGAGCPLCSAAGTGALCGPHLAHLQAVAAERAGRPWKVHADPLLTFPAMPIPASVREAGDVLPEPGVFGHCPSLSSAYGLGRDLLAGGHERVHITNPQLPGRLWPVEPSRAAA